MEKGKACFFEPHTGDVIISGSEHIRSFSVPIWRVRRSKLTPEYLLVKRAMDIALSRVAIIASGPFMIATALAILANRNSLRFDACLALDLKYTQERSP